MFYILFIFCIFDTVKSDVDIPESDNKLFEYHFKAMKWFDALLECHRRSRTLAAPRTIEEAHELADLIAKAASRFSTSQNEYNKHARIFVGIHQQFLKNELVSVLDDSINDLLFELNRGFDKQNDMKCGMLDDYSEISMENCFTQHFFACENRPNNQVVVKDITQAVADMRSTQLGIYPYPNGIINIYKIHNGPSEWAVARAVCRAEGSYLAVPKDVEEKNYIQSLLQKHVEKSPWAKKSDFRAYLGIHDMFDKGYYLTTTSEEIKLNMYDRFESNQKDSNGDCVGIKTLGDYFVFNCNEPGAFVCQKQVKLNIDK